MLDQTTDSVKDEQCQQACEAQWSWAGRLRFYGSYSQFCVIIDPSSSLHGCLAHRYTSWKVRSMSTRGPQSLSSLLGDLEKEIEEKIFKVLDYFASTISQNSSLQSLTCSESNMWIHSLLLRRWDLQTNIERITESIEQIRICTRKWSANPRKTEKQYETGQPECWHHFCIWCFGAHSLSQLSWITSLETNRYVYT